MYVLSAALVRSLSKVKKKKWIQCFCFPTTFILTTGTTLSRIFGFFKEAPLRSLCSYFWDTEDTSHNTNAIRQHASGHTCFLGSLFGDRIPDLFRGTDAATRAVPRPRAWEGAGGTVCPPWGTPTLRLLWAAGAQPSGTAWPPASVSRGISPLPQTSPLRCPSCTEQPLSCTRTRGGCVSFPLHVCRDRPRCPRGSGRAGADRAAVGTLSGQKWSRNVFNGEENKFYYVSD